MLRIRTSGGGASSDGVLKPQINAEVDNKLNPGYSQHSNCSPSSFSFSMSKSKGQDGKVRAHTYCW